MNLLWSRPRSEEESGNGLTARFVGMASREDKQPEIRRERLDEGTALEFAKNVVSASYFGKYRLKSFEASTFEPIGRSQPPLRFEVDTDGRIVSPSADYLAMEVPCAFSFTVVMVPNPAQEG